MSRAFPLTGMFTPLSDDPISSPSDDILGRDQFVRNLASALVSYPIGRSLVIALDGGWGAGKSSTLQLVERELARKHDLSVVWFRPWHYESLPALAEALLSALAAADVSREQNWLTRVRSSFNPWSPARRYRRALRSASKSFHGQTVRGATLNFWVASIEFGRRQMEPVSTAFDHASDGLRRLDARIVLAVEDLDRLNHDQARQFFSLLFSIRQLNAITVVLPVDLVEMKRLLDRDDHLISRLVDSTFPLPAIEQVQIDEYLLEKIAAVSAASGIRLTSDQDIEFSEKYRRVIAPTIQTLRGAKRFVNSIQLGIVMAASEVNVVDLLVLEYLRTFHPDHYAQMPQMRMAFTGVVSSETDVLAFSEERRTAERRRQLLAWLEQDPDAAERVGAAADALVTGIVQFANGGSEREVSYDDETALRFRSHLHFNRYFLYRPESADVSYREIDRCLEAVSEGGGQADEAFASFVKENLASGLMLFDRLGHRALSLPPDAQATLGRIVAANSDLYSNTRGFGESSQSRRAGALLYQIAENSESPQEQFTKWLEVAGTLGFVCQILDFLDPERNHIFSRWDDIDLPALKQLTARILDVRWRELPTTAEHPGRLLRHVGRDAAEKVIERGLASGWEPEEILSWFRRYEGSTELNVDFLEETIDPEIFRSRLEVPAGSFGGQLLAAVSGDQFETPSSSD